MGEQAETESLQDRDYIGWEGRSLEDILLSTFGGIQLKLAGSFKSLGIVLYLAS